MLLFDVTHTSHSTANTGVQRVTRELLRALQDVTPVQPVLWDPFAATWRTPDRLETGLLASSLTRRPRLKRGSRWTHAQRWRGYLDRFRGNPRALRGHYSGFVTVEIFSPAVWRAFPLLRDRVDGPRVAVFHDAIPLKYPYLTPRETVRRFPEYLKQLHDFDGIAAVSDASRHDLTGYWEWLGMEHDPATRTITPGLTPLAAAPSAPDSGLAVADPRILCVGSIEGRKNQETLLQACEILWAEGERFGLELAGIANRETGARTLCLLRELQKRGRPAAWHGPVADADLHRLYHNCMFTVYPSHYEGFGLPVWESLRHGKPCICGAGGALEETARGGGCAILDSAADPGELARTIRRLLHDTDAYARLRLEAESRSFPQWSESAAALLDWIESLRSPQTGADSGSAHRE